MADRDLQDVDVAVIGAGNVGISVAYYLLREGKFSSVVLIDPRDPMSLTSAQSGENYRNWWPHPVMTAFTDHGISLLEEIGRETDGRLNITRGGYALVTRRDSPNDLIDDLHRGYGPADVQIRVREQPGGSYQPPCRSPWDLAPGGVDVLLNRELIRKTFPSYALDVAAVIHIRRAGSFSAQQLGQVMLEEIRRRGGRVLRAELKGVSSTSPFTLELAAASGSKTLRAGKIVNAAGPYLRHVSNLLGEDVPVRCVYQQKIAFQDRAAAIPRDMPFSIDLDSQTLDWSEEDLELLASDAATRFLAEPMQGGIHCRPDGAVDGNWVKLGWAYNDRSSDPQDADPVDAHFPDTVLRGASRLHPALSAYIGRLPRSTHHYGGYYTMTEENWPLIGPMRTEGAFVAGALSGFGSMAACSTGAICAAWVAGTPVPDYARLLSSERFADKELMSQLSVLGKGSL